MGSENDCLFEVSRKYTSHFGKHTGSIISEGLQALISLEYVIWDDSFDYTCFFVEISRAQ